MVGIGEQLKKFWRRQGIKLAPGAKEEELCAFEDKYQVRLPKALREYLAVVNGFDGSEYWMTDNSVITFYGLDEIKPLGEYWSPQILNAESYFVFADYSISAHVYAIALQKTEVDQSPIAVVYDRTLIQVADSFSKFVEDYLQNIDAILFPSP